MNKSQNNKICFKCKKAFTKYVVIDGKYKPSCCFSKNEDVQETQTQNEQTNNKQLDITTIFPMTNLKLVEKPIETKIILDTCFICLDDKSLKEFVTIHDNHRVCIECNKIQKFEKCPLCRKDEELYKDDQFQKYFNDTDDEYIKSVKRIIYYDCYDYTKKTDEKLNVEQREYRDVKSYVLSWKYQKTTGFNRPMEYKACMLGISLCYHDKKQYIDKRKTLISKRISEITLLPTPDDQRYKNNLIRMKFKQYDSLLIDLEKYLIENQHGQEFMSYENCVAEQKAKEKKEHDYYCEHVRTLWL